MSFYEYSANYTPPIPTCQVYLGPGGGETRLGPLEALIDTGADITVIPIHYLRQIKAKRVSRGKARSLWGDTRTVDIYAVALAVNGLQVAALQTLADDQGEEIVLGRQVLNRLKIVLDGPAAVMEIVETTL
jgi:predicted aspartyl protease